MIKPNLYILLLTGYLTTFSQSFQMDSPDGKTEVKLEIGNQMTFSVRYDRKPVIEKGVIAMNMGDDGVVGMNAVIKKQSTYEGDLLRQVSVPTKDAKISYKYSGLELQFTDQYGVRFMVFDHAVAYRFFNLEENKKKAYVYEELLDLKFPEDSWSYFPQEKSLYSHYEQHYLYKPVDSVNTSDFCSLPVRFDVPGGVGVLLAEADQFDYPGLFLEKNTDGGFRSRFPQYVLETQPLPGSPDRSEIIKKEAPYIAESVGAREYPWRVFIISDDDRDFVKNDFILPLSRVPEKDDFDWVKPGKIAWDWYNANNVYGVDFESGINTATYKYYIDFASEYGLEYVVLDEGWSKTTTNVLESSPEIDVSELVAYGKKKGVEIILWMLWKPLDENMEEILATYSKWGVKGIKVDFMQRADQYMVRFYERVAQTAAKYRLLVDFHGAFKPAGLRSLYPNVLTYEGVKGNENNKWEDLVTPEHNVTLPFTRMATGPMDYTPGAMANAQQLNFNISFYRPMSQGTRCHQGAMYVVYESPLQMLCDAPSAYLNDQPYTAFISRIPVVWDETVVLHGKIGDYIVVARRKGDTWYIGGMTDWSPRTFTVDLSFLGDGPYKMEILKDGMNASKYAEDYVLETISVTNKSSVEANLAPGGGWAAIVTPLK